MATKQPTLPRFDTKGVRAQLRREGRHCGRCPNCKAWEQILRKAWYDHHRGNLDECGGI